MNVLILSCNNGGGHNAVAQALQEIFDAHGDTCCIRDCLSFISDNVSNAVARSHNFMYRHAPEAFADSYRRSEQNPDFFRENHNARRFIDLGKYQLGRFIRDGHYEAVLCTHVFAAMMLTAAKKKYSLAIASGIVETDYTCTPGAADNDVDFHFVPTYAVQIQLMDPGVLPEHILVSGIPVRKSLYERLNKEAAKRRLGVAPDHKHLLMMGGSMGCGPIPELLDALYLRLDEDVEISVVCGSNERVKKSLESSYGHLRNIHVLGYVADMSSLYDSADLLMTKPGGISTTEAAVKRLPMVLVNAVAGCEAYNLSFFVGSGGAVSAETEHELAESCLRLLHDDKGRTAMAQALERIILGNNREVIYSAMKLLSERNCVWTA